MWQDVRDWCLQCGRCSAAKATRPKARTFMGSLLATRPLEIVAIDFTLLERASSSHENVLVITDVFSKFTQAYPVPDQKASTVVKVLTEKWFYVYGVPQRIHSDQGSSFEGELLRCLCELYGIEKSRTTPYHPQGNGQCERFNRTLHDLLRILQPEKKKKWPRLLPQLLFAYNTTVHQSTQYSLYELLFGQKPQLPVDGLLGNVGDEEGKSVDLSDWVAQHREHLVDVYAKAKGHLEQAAAYRRRNHNEPVLLLSQGVRVHCRNHFHGRHKMQDLWSTTIFKVVECLDQVGTLYKIRPIGGEGGCRTVHWSELKVVVSAEDPLVPTAQGTLGLALGPALPSPQGVELEDSEEESVLGEAWLCMRTREAEAVLKVPQPNFGRVLAPTREDQEPVGSMLEGSEPTSSESSTPSALQVPQTADYQESGPLSAPIARHSIHTTAGKHSNPFNLPRPAVLSSIHSSAITSSGDQQWGMNYAPERVCALKRSSVDLSCTYKHPEGLTVTRSFWYIESLRQSGVEPEDVGESDQYKGRVQYSRTLNSCRMTITDLRESDAHTYSFSFYTDDPDGSFSGSPGVSLSVTDLKVTVSDTDGGVKKLTCSSTCTLPNNPTYIWYKNGQPVSDQNRNELKLRDRTVDAGSYSCAVKGYEKLGSPAVCVFDKGLQVKVEGPAATASVGWTVTLTCSSTCALPNNPTYIWYKNRQPVSQCESASCPVAVVSEAVSYSCAVEGSDLHSPPVYSPKTTRVVILPSGQRVEGDSVTLTCSSDADPPVLSYSWFSQRSDVELGTGQSYSITSISSQHSGLYYCTAQNQLRQSYSNLQNYLLNYLQNYLHISFLTSVVQAEADRKTVGQKVVKLTCSAPCRPSGNCYYSWFRGKRWYSSGEYVGCSYSASVWLNSTSSSDQDSYTCEVKNYIHPQQHCEQQWGVNYTAERVCALKGSSVDLSCTYKHPEGLTVTRSLWFIESQGTPGDEHKDIRESDQYKGRVQYSQILNSCRMTITDLRESDTHTYSFRFYTDDPGGRYSGRPGVTLSVTDLKVTVSDTDGGEKKLNCSSTCTLPNNPTYIWYKNGEPVSQCESASCSVAVVSEAVSYSCAVKGSDLRSPPVWQPNTSSTSVLSFGELEQMDRVLRCYWGQRQWQQHCSKPSSAFSVIHCIHADSPRPPSVSETEFDGSVTLVCVSDSNPASSYTWFRKTGGDTTRFGEGASLTLAAGADGVFYCTAENLLGSSTSSGWTLTSAGLWKQFAVWGTVGVGSALVLSLITAVLCIQQKLLTCLSVLNLCDQEEERSSERSRRSGSKDWRRHVLSSEPQHHVPRLRHSDCCPSSPSDEKSSRERELTAEFIYSSFPTAASALWTEH
ncbi:hypothetical protein MHYP_G00061880 [Metynnis hypsauchen]